LCFAKSFIIIHICFLVIFDNSAEIATISGFSRQSGILF